MRTSFKKMTAILLSTVIVLTAVIISPMSASAATITTNGDADAVSVEGYNIAVWADPENVLSQTSIDDFNSGDTLATNGGIKPYIINAPTSSTLGTILASSLQYYWFFPSTADLSAMTFWFDSSSTVTIDGTAITSGEPSDVLADINEGGVTRTIALTIDDTEYSVIAIKSGDVGAVYIATESGSLSSINGSDDHSVSETGTIIVVEADGTVDYNGTLDKMSGRGNGTWNDDTKKPYNIKLAKSTSLLGMSAAKKWCLLANSGDATLIKDQLTYDFAKYIGVNYQPVCKPVDVYVNQQYIGSYQLSERVEIKSNRVNISDAYENLEIANGTVDETTGAVVPADLDGTAVVTTNQTKGLLYDYTGQTVGAYTSSPSLTDPDDCSGGYIYELEISNRWVDENAGFCAYNRQGWVIKSADYASDGMVSYSYDLLYALGSSVYNDGIVPSEETTTSCSKLSRTSTTTGYGSSSVTNPAPAEEYQGMSWSDLLDADSAVRYYWTQEFFKNMDSSTSSTYFYKESDSIDSTLYAGPVWDMDNAIGFDVSSSSRWGLTWTDSTGWYTKSARMYRWRANDSTTTYSSDDYSPLNFYAALATNCDDFWTMAEKYWYAYISPAVDILLGNSVDETGTLKSAEEYINAVALTGLANAIRYGGGTSATYDVDTQVSGINTWFAERQEWINSEISQIDISSASISSIDSQSYTGDEITPSPTVTLTTSDGDVVLEEGTDYTLSYENNVNAGTATVTVTGAGIYISSVSAEFEIVASSLEDGYTLEIDENAYADDVLTAELAKDGTTLESESAVTYQWYKDGTAIDSATSQTYTVSSDDVGSAITVIATGDGVSLTGSVASNECTILSGTRPVADQRTIAEWNYDYTLDSSALVTADETGSDYYYLATGGVNQSSSNLYASVNASDNAEIKWSGSADLYKNDSTSLASDQSPIMGTSKSDGLAWGSYPYFETVISTAGYEDIKFTAKLGGTKKAPRDWKLQYSLDGETYIDIEGAEYTITDNKSMELAFDSVSLPDECSNQLTLYIRMVVYDDIAINGTNTIVNQTSGDASVNNIAITGTTLSVITSLYSPTVTPEDGSVIFDDDTVTITDNNGGTDVYYSVNGGEDTLYSGSFNPFDSKTAKVGDTAIITAYSKYNDIVSDSTAVTVTFGGVNINSFDYSTYSDNVINGAVASTGGVYDESGRMTATADGTTQYVPLWNDDNMAFSVSPDDGLTWSEESGFTFKVSTAGYENTNFSCKAYTTTHGPNSVTLQYSLDGETYYNIQSDVELADSGTLEQLFLTASLPSACDNQTVVYIRLATTENLTDGGSVLHQNASKGNFYVNNVMVAGEDNGDYKMPYTNKSTSYFGSSGTVKYVSPDGMSMQYAVYDSNNNVVLSGTYPSKGIQLTNASGFDETKQTPYKVLVWVQEDEETSLVNSASYYYKGDTVAEFDYNSTTKLLSSYISSDGTYVNETDGVNGGSLSMYPDGETATTLDYTGTYGVKVSYSSSNPFAATKVLDNPDGNGYWLIKTSSEGYYNLTLSAEQVSSNKGPRDWGIAYSTDGENYTYVTASNARAVSNDAFSDTVETYSNIALPSECDNQEVLYIKIFINGGESVDGTELADVTKGNTGIDAVEICGTPQAATIDFTATVLESQNADEGNVGYEGVSVYVDGTLKGTTDENGQLTFDITKGKDYTITVSGNSIVERTIEITDAQSGELNVPVLIFDVNGDGYINVKDYAVISKDSTYDSVKQYFQNFINVKTSEFTYAQ